MTRKSGIVLKVNGEFYDQWTSAEVTRDMKEFSGSFSFEIRTPAANQRSLAYVSAIRIKTEVKRGMPAEVYIDGEMVLKGWVENRDAEIDDMEARVSVSGRDVTGDMIDSASVVDGPAEFKSVKYEEAVSKIAAPFGIKVRKEVDTGETFERYGLDQSETAMSAIEKGARSRQVLVMSDGIGGIVITRAGATRAPAELRLPGNVISSRLSESDEEQYSDTIVRGQCERAAGKRKSGPLDSTAEPLSVASRTAGDGSQTAIERQGTVATGRSKNPDMKRYRPIVHLARSKANADDAQAEADWRQKTGKALAVELTHVVRGFKANGKLWRVNQTASVADSWQDIDRDLLVSKLSYRDAEGEGPTTELTLVDPDAFDPKGSPKKNRSGKHGKKSAKSSGPLDGTAEAL